LISKGRQDGWVSKTCVLLWIMQWSYDKCIENYKEDEEKEDLRPPIQTIGDIIRK
jgi:hypothetical protein